MLKIYSLVANRRGVGIVGELESFSNINKQGARIVEGWKIFQIIIPVGGLFKTLN